MRLIFCIMLFFLSQVHAYELVVIQAVSTSKKTMITRKGKREGIVSGQRATFTAEDVSILVKAVNVHSDFTQWEILNPDAVIPFHKGTVVTYYPATEYLWALTPEHERQKFIKSEIPRVRKSWIFKGAFSRGVSESVSDAPANTPRRGGYLGEIYYEKDLFPRFAFNAGLRYEREVINYSGASLVTLRNIAVVHALYYFNPIQDLYRSRVFLGLGVGYGLSNTSTVGLSQSGVVSLMPAALLGLSLPFNDKLDFISDLSFESFSTREKKEDGKIQTTSQTNAKIGLGLRYYY